jgi:uncharacterized protein (DUF433 family)/DNA-binding transcriptional MerR regulator
MTRRLVNNGSMPTIAAHVSEGAPLGIGFYIAAEAARLLKTPARNIHRWLGGYTYRERGSEVTVPPLWQPQLPAYGHHLELGFRDLVELRFIKAFLDAGLGLKTIRYCLNYARECVQDDRPFSTRRFQTDGRTIFLDSARRMGEGELLDLKSRQYVLKQVIERTFKDLDIDKDAVARWRPYGGKASIVVDPQRAFGQPISSDGGVPTVTLADALEVESSLARVAYLFDVPAAVVRDAVNFEKSLRAA